MAQGRKPSHDVWIIQKTCSNNKFRSFKLNCALFNGDIAAAVARYQKKTNLILFENNVGRRMEAVYVYDTK